MSNYTKSTNFATKDNLTPGDPLKVVRGTEIDTEFNNIATAIATKTDNASAAITGGSITGITDLAVADGGTGASTAAGGLNNLLPSQTSNANKYLQTDGTNASWDAVSLSTADITGTLPVANGGTGVTSSTGTGNVVLSNSPTLVTPALGTPASGVATNITGLPISTGVSGLGTGVATFLGTPSSANLASAVSDETGSGALVFANSPTLVTPALGTPSALVGTNITGTASGLTAGNVTTNANLTGAVTSVGNATSLGSFTSSQLAGALTDETGSGSAVFATSPTLVTPILGTPTSATLTNATGLPIATGVSGLGTGIATALAVNTGSAGAPVLFNGALGTPSSGTVTNLTGTASININGTVGATTATTGAFTTLTTSSTVTHNGGTANGVTYLNGSKVLTSGSALTFDGTTLTNNVGVLKLDNYGAAAGKGLINFGSSGPASIEGFDAGNGGSGAYLKFGINGELMRLTSTGLGIGTSSPTAKLHVVSSSLSSVISECTAVGNNAQFISKTTTRQWNIGGNIVDSSAGTLEFYDATAGATRLRLDTSGNLGLGVTPSAWGTLYSTKAFQISASSVVMGDVNSTILGTNYYYDSAFATKYIKNNYALQYAQDGSTGIHKWLTAASGTAGNAITFTQAMTLDASGRLLVGQTSGPTTVSIATPSTATGLGVFSNSQIALNNPTTVGAYSQIAFGYNSGTSIANAAASIGFISTSADTWGKGDLVFATRNVTTDTAPTERARITSDGNFLIGNTVVDPASGFSTQKGFGYAFATGKVEIATTANAPTLELGKNNANDGSIVVFRKQATTVGSISVTGSATAYNTSSDQRLKENIQDSDSASSLIDSLQVRKFDWKSDNSHQRYGFVAQELVTVAPEAVYQPTDTEEMMAVDYSKLVPMLVKEIQSLRQRLSAANL